MPTSKRKMNRKRWKRPKIINKRYNGRLGLKVNTTLPTNNYGKMVGYCLLMSIMSFCRPVQNSLNNLGIVCLCPLCSSVGSVQNSLKKLGFVCLCPLCSSVGSVQNSLKNLGVVSLCPLCSSVKNGLYMRNRGGGGKKTRVRNLSERALTIEIVWALRLMK